jgi:UDP-N-acetylglucosamine 2-epimerase
MSKIRIMVVVGTRPQFIKSAPLVSEILSRRARIELNIVHSGQHYDPQMSQIFFHQLQIPRPFMNLRAGPGSHARQTATIMERLEEPMLKARPDLVIVPGDTNTTLASALTAAKLDLPVAHLEAGLRSRDMTMPEEINRRLTDHCSSMLFAPTKNAASNLETEGLSRLTYFTGDTMVDALRTVAPFVERKQNAILERFGLTPRQYVLVTLHRPSNVDDLGRLRKILLALRQIALKLRVVFPVHPRTHLQFVRLGAPGHCAKNSITFANPQGYLEILGLLKNASCLLTDSGGMQKESFLLHVPCVTLRSTTEWPETLVARANQLINRPDMIPRTIMATALDDSLRKRMRRPKDLFGDGHAAERIAHILQEKL